MDAEFEQNLQCKNISYLRARDPSILACGYPIGNVKANLREQFVESISDTIKETLKVDKHLQVYLRLKNIENFKDLYEIDDNSLLCKVPEGAQCVRNVRDGTSVTKIFKFSKIFEPESKQTTVFNDIVKEKVLCFINGLNCNLLTYGASGSGKTYTIVGTANQPGIIPRALEYLFRTLPQLPEEPLIKPADSGEIIRLTGSAKKLEKAASQNLLNSSAANAVQHVRTYRTMQQRLSSEPVAIIADEISDVSLGVWVSFAEIYNESVYDLLTPQPIRGQSRKKLQLGHCKGNAYIKDLKYINVTSGLQAYQLLQYGLHNLNYAATSINDHSSRSHSIFTIKLAQASDTKGGISVSSFNFCDLAGSERLKKTHNVGDRLKESNNINTSLLVLGRCVSLVREAQKNKNKNSNKLIPFRESKLTQLFQRALLGHEAISMIVNINPTRGMFDESQHVLNFSAIAKDVTIEQQQLIQRPRKNRFSQYIEGRSTGFPAITEEMENSQLEELQTVVADLVEEIQQQKLDAKEDREHIISEYKKILHQTEEHWKERCQELENRLAKSAKAFIENSQQQQQTRKRKMSVIVLDSSSEGEDKNEIETKSRKRNTFHSKETFAICQKELAEIKLKLKTRETEIRIITEENKLLKKTLQDATESYKDLELQYQTTTKELEKKIIQQQDEINTLIPYRDNFQSYILNDDTEEKEYSDAVSLQQSNSEPQKLLAMELAECEQYAFQETTF